MPITDELLHSNMIHKETYSKLRSVGNSQDKTRELYIALDSGGESVKSTFYTLLKKNCPHLVMDSASTDDTPAAVSQIPGEYIDQVTEIRGFSDPQKEEYFRKRFSDQDHLSQEDIEEPPHYSSVDQPLFLSRCCEKTIMEKFTRFLLIQTGLMMKKYSLQTEKQMIMKLGKLAFNQLQRGNRIFYKEDLNTCGIGVTDTPVHFGLCTQIFKKKDLMVQRDMYSVMAHWGNTPLGQRRHHSVPLANT
ncbi:hypothetical protein Z043_125486, partial [Scleropages formosus]